MRKRTFFSTCALVAGSALAVACGDASGAAGPTAWEGPDAHLVAQGVVDGVPVAFTLRGQDASDAYCERNYVVPSVGDSSTWSNGFLEKVELKWDVTVNGTERQYQVELSGHDYAASADGQTLPVVAYDEDAERATGTVQAAVEIEWEDDGMEFEHGDESETGTFTRGLFSGTAGADGVVVPSGSGSFGGYLHLTWASGDYLDVSFTVACGDNDMDIP
jgi:hypothetical protein